MIIGVESISVESIRRPRQVCYGGAAAVDSRWFVDIQLCNSSWTAARGERLTVDALTADLQCLPAGTPCDPAAADTAVDHKSDTGLANIRTGLQHALNDIDIAQYFLHHVLRGATERLKPYLAQFVTGFFASMHSQACVKHVRNKLGVLSAPIELRDALRRQLEAFELHQDETSMIWDLFPQDRSKLDQLKQFHVLDNAISEGLVVGALAEAKATSWQEHLVRQVKVSVVLGDLKANEKEIEHMNGCVAPSWHVLVQCSVSNVHVYCVQCV